jgi:lambda family phage portal protein
MVVEVIDPERLETPPDMISNPRVRLGIERDERGRITTYHIRKTHPFDTVDVSEEFDHIPARRVMHVFERWFAGQLRGLPWLTRCLNRAKDAKDNDEAEIIRRQVNACFAMFIETEFNAQTAANAAASSTDASRRYQEIRPGAIQYLNPGEKPIFSNPTAAGGYGEFQEITLRRIAAGLNMPFELMVKNWSGVSFAGGRLILNEWRLDVKSRQKLINELFLTPIWNRMVWEAVLLGQCSIEPRLFFARQYVYEAHSWTPPAWSYAITPGEEVKANAEAVRQNQRTLASVIAEDGGDLEDVLIQRKRENELLREYDILPPDIVTAEAQAASVEQAAQQKEVANAV